VDITEGSDAEPEDDYRTEATALLRALLQALPPDGPRDVGLRSAVEQRAAGLRDLVDFEREHGGSKDLSHQPD
jgi:hypothetical protein